MQVVANVGAEGTGVAVDLTALLVPAREQPVGRTAVEAGDVELVDQQRAASTDHARESLQRGVERIDVMEREHRDRGIERIVLSREVDQSNLLDALGAAAGVDCADVITELTQARGEFALAGPDLEHSRRRRRQACAHPFETPQVQHPGRYTELQADARRVRRRPGL